MPSSMPILVCLSGTSPPGFANSATQSAALLLLLPPQPSHPPVSLLLITCPSELSFLLHFFFTYKKPSLKSGYTTTDDVQKCSIWGCLFCYKIFISHDMDSWVLASKQNQTIAALPSLSPTTTNTCGTRHATSMS